MMINPPGYSPYEDKPPRMIHLNFSGVNFPRGEFKFIGVNVRCFTSFFGVNFPRGECKLYHLCFLGVNFPRGAANVSSSKNSCGGEFFMNESNYQCIKYTKL